MSNTSDHITTRISKNRTIDCWNNDIISLFSFINVSYASIVAIVESAAKKNTRGVSHLPPMVGTNNLAR